MGADGLTTPFVPSDVGGRTASDTRAAPAATSLGTNVGGNPIEVGRSRLVPVLIAWVLAALILTLAMADNIATLRFVDPDDAMRLMEVRDWLAGQSWWDVAQHRFNRGDFPMHWSRLVDIPLAAVLMLAAHWYEAREAAVIGATANSVPYGIHQLLSPHRMQVTGHVAES